MLDYQEQLKQEIEDIITSLRYLTKKGVSTRHKNIQIEYVEQKLEEVLFLYKRELAY